MTRPEATGAPLPIALCSLALGALLAAASARADRAEPGRQLTLRHGLPSASAVDLGGPERDGAVEATLGAGSHHVEERFPLPGRHTSAPVSWANGAIAVASSEGLWLRSPSGESTVLALGPIDARPVVLPSGALLVATREGRLVALDAAGHVLREGRASASVRTSPLVLEDGSIVVTALDRTVSRHDADLRRVFVVTLPAGLVHPPARLSTDRIAVAAGERLYVLDLSGSILRTVDLGDRAVTAPVIDRAGDAHVLLALGTIVIVSQGAFVRSRLPLGGRVFDQSAMLARGADGTYRVAIPAIGLVAFDAEGRQLWVASTDAPFYGPLALDGAGSTLAFDRRGRLVVISSAGEILERLELGGLVATFPLVASDGTMWATTDAPALVHVVSTP